MEYFFDGAWLLYISQLYVGHAATLIRIERMATQKDVYIFNTYSYSVYNYFRDCSESALRWGCSIIGPNCVVGKDVTYCTYCWTAICNTLLIRVGGMPWKQAQKQTNVDQLKSWWLSTKSVMLTPFELLNGLALRHHQSSPCT